jgi:hypothetical protein
MLPQNSSSVRAGSARHREPLVLGGHQRSRPAYNNGRSLGIHRYDLGRRSSIGQGSNPSPNTAPGPESEAPGYPGSAMHRRPGSVGGRGSRHGAAVRLGPEQPLKLHEALDPSVVGADVRLDLGGQLADSGQVDAEQLRAPLQWRRDRPAQVRVVPGPHRDRLANRRSRIELHKVSAKATSSGPM